MLILEMKIGESVNLTDEGKDVGVVKFLSVRESKKNCVVLGFICPRNITVLREKLLRRRAAR